MKLQDAKTNPRRVEITGWMTWTFDPIDPNEDAEQEQPEAVHPTPLDFAMVILPILRRFPEAYNLMVEAIRERWPILAPA
jgi:hypothetical protein